MQKYVIKYQSQFRFSEVIRLAIAEAIASYHVRYILVDFTFIKMAESWDRLFGDLASFVLLCGIREDGATTAVAESTLLKLENYIYVVNTLINTLSREESLRSGTYCS